MHRDRFNCRRQDHAAAPETGESSFRDFGNREAFDLGGDGDLWGILLLRVPVDLWGIFDLWGTIDLWGTTDLWGTFDLWGTPVPGDRHGIPVLYI